MDRVGFQGFSPGLFRFLRGLTSNNNKEWFDKHRREYDNHVLGPVKAFVRGIGPTLHMLNPSLEIEPRVGRTLSRISINGRFNKNRPRYRPVVYVGFPRRGIKWRQEALLYVGIYAHGIAAGFSPGGHRERSASPLQDAIRTNTRLFQRYLTTRGIAERYSELVDGEDGNVARWPLPKTARRWVNVESFTVGEYFSASEGMVCTGGFLDRVQQIMLDLYPLWLFATSAELKSDFDLYNENIRLLSHPLAQAAD